MPPSHTDIPPDGPSAEQLRQRAAQRSTWVSVVVNIVLTLAQAGVGLLAHSQALVADALHSLSDLLSDAVVLVANRASGKAPDDDHHYGHLRYENAASLVIGLLLLAVAAGMLWSGITKLSIPQDQPPVQQAALWMALVALVGKELLFRYLLKVGESVRSSLLVANAWHARSDAASSLVVLAGIGGSLLGFPLLDPVAAMVVGLMVLRMGLQFSWRALHALMDQAASEGENRQIEALIRATPQVLGLHGLRTRRMGDMILVDVHLEINGQLSVKEGHDIALAARERVMAALPVLNVMTHIDPV